jgi:hypothetical protein
MTRLRKVSRAAFLVILCVAGVSTDALAQFETRTSVPAEQFSESIAVGDFNRDGKLDFAVANNSLQVFLGNGDGTFQPAANYLSGTGVIFVAAADFNQDGKLDLAVADLNGLFVLIGNGDGTFQTPVAYPTACIPIFVSTGDFNGDHKVDLLVTYSSGSCGYVSIFLGNGDGTFQQTPINTSTLYNPAATGIGDFNADGKLDLAVAEQFGMISQVEILLGNGNGTFSSTATYKVGASPTSVAVADFRGNGKLDLAVATLPGWTYVLLGNGDGTFASAGRSATPDADWVVAADFNGDGKPDLAVASESFPPRVNVLLGNGDGTFQPPMYYPVGTNDRFVGVGDFNGDHKTDLIVPDYRYGFVVLLLNTGVVSFSPTKPVSYPFQLVGTVSAPQTVTLTNTGTTALSISSIQASNPFHQNNTCGKSVAPGAKCDIEITFKPKVPGKVGGTVSISDSASSKPQVIELTGSGTLANISPLKLSFAPQLVGTKSPPQNITLTNASTTAMSVTLIYVDGTDYRDFPETNNCPVSLNVGASCTIAVTFDPAKKGSRTADVFIKDNGGGSPQGIPLAGTGT